VFTERRYVLKYAPGVGRALPAGWPAAPPLPPPQVYLGLLVVQAATRIPLSFCLGPRLVNAVSLRKQSNFLCL
jgi:hypothetical protein